MGKWNAIQMMDNTGKDSPLLQHVKNIPISSKLAVIWIQIKMFSRELKFRWQTLNSPKQTPHGFVFWGNRHVVNGTFEPQETKIFNSLLPYVEEVINVGANVGYYCCHALGKNKLVTAFEPDPLNIRYLLSNIRANGWSHNFELFDQGCFKDIKILDRNWLRVREVVNQNSLVDQHFNFS